MNSRILLLLLIIFSTFGTMAQARLGDTEAEITARYGKGSNPGQSFHMYYTQGWVITVWLMDGISACEKFQKNSGTTDQDIATLLSLNSQGHTWKVKPVEHTPLGTFLPIVDPISKSWERDDGAFASVPNPAFWLTIKTKKFLDAEQAQAEADKKAKESSLKSF
jgi:hypothetical protein